SFCTSSHRAVRKRFVNSWEQCSSRVSQKGMYVTTSDGFSKEARSTAAAALTRDAVTTFDLVDRGRFFSMAFSAIGAGLKKIFRLEAPKRGRGARLQDCYKSSPHPDLWRSRASRKRRKAVADHNRHKDSTSPPDESCLVWNANRNDGLPDRLALF